MIFFLNRIIFQEVIVSILGMVILLGYVIMQQKWSLSLTYVEGVAYFRFALHKHTHIRFISAWAGLRGGGEGGGICPPTFFNEKIFFHHKDNIHRPCSDSVPNVVDGTDFNFEFI